MDQVRYMDGADVIREFSIFSRLNISFSTRPRTGGAERDCTATVCPEGWVVALDDPGELADSDPTEESQVVDTHRAGQHPSCAADRKGEYISTASSTRRGLRLLVAMGRLPRWS